MLLRNVLLLSVLAALSRCQRLQFPPNFKFGAATSAYQVEGAWNVSDKSPSIWDNFVHLQPSPVSDQSTGDVTSDSYHQWERDIEIANEMHLDYYRFSLSWTRILPDGFSNRVSKEGIRYYNNLINGLLDRGIEPMVTIYHWDLPQPLQDLGGWLSPLIAEWYLDYARVAFTHFGDRVKTWLTINEPLLMCDVVYNSGKISPPQIQDDSILPCICTKNVLLAYAKAWRLYDVEFRDLHNGRVSLTNLFVWFEPVNEDDSELSELANEFNIGRYAHPIFSKDGGWPRSLERLIANNSAAEGFPRSRLPAFTSEEISLIKGTYDFFGLNHYGGQKIRKARPGEVPERWGMMVAHDLGNPVYEGSPNWTLGGNGWLYEFPASIRRSLQWLKEHYGDIEYVVTETGIATKQGLEDTPRVKYIQEQLTQILLSIYEDGVNVSGYILWSLIDSFEWSGGFTVRMGLYDVDFNDPARKRTPKISAKYYANVTTNRALDKLYL